MRHKKEKKSIITIEETKKRDVVAFWRLHWEYLSIAISDENDTEDVKKHFCSEEYRYTIEHVQADEAKYFKINVANERAHGFWINPGFADDATDRYGKLLMGKMKLLGSEIYEQTGRRAIFW